MLLWMAYFAAYITVSYIVTGALTGTFLLNHHLYWVNYIIILLLVRKQYPAFFEDLSSDLNSKKWILWFAAILVIIILLSIVSTNIHGEMSGSHNRFQV
jgi:hypothetical protein